MNEVFDIELNSLQTRFADCVHATFFRRGDLLGVDVHNAHGAATVLLQGAQLLEFTPHGEDRVIWCSDAVAYKSGVPLRGGVPVCWPWFGPLENNTTAIQNQCVGPVDSAPQHGFVRTLDWDLVLVESLPDGGTAIELTLCDSFETQSMLACAFELVMRFEIGGRLHLALTARNTDTNSTMSFTSALHSYFAVSNIKHSEVLGLDAMFYVDSLDDGAIKSQQGAVGFDAEVDRIYFAQPGEGLTPLTIRTPERDIIVESSGSDSAIVWNPWIEKSRGLSQFRDTDYQRMLCVETANAFQNVISLPPGASHRLSVTVSTATRP